MVRIGDTLIPAVAIQIDGFPCIIDGDPYDIYFEIPYETGDLWEVSCDNINILLEERSGDMKQQGATTFSQSFPSWDAFLCFYKNYNHHH